MRPRELWLNETAPATDAGESEAEDVKAWAAIDTETITTPPGLFQEIELARGAFVPRRGIISIQCSVHRPSPFPARGGGGLSSIRSQLNAIVELATFPTHIGFARPILKVLAEGIEAIERESNYRIRLETAQLDLGQEPPEPGWIEFERGPYVTKWRRLHVVEFSPITGEGDAA